MLDPLVISAMDGVFPGADTVDALWQQIQRAQVAPLTDMCAAWGVREDAVKGPFPGDGRSTYVTQAHALDTRSLGLGKHRQESAARIVFERLIRGRNNLRHTGIVFGTSWSSDSYLDADVAAFTGTLPPGVTGPFDPADQLQRIVQHRIGGPVLAVDTACASSLYALETATQVIASGQAESMIVFGLNAFLPLFLFVGFSKLGALSPTAALQPYLANGNGIVLGEAAAGVCIEPLSVATRYRHEVLAVIKTLALSADGADRSVFAPGIEGQHHLYSRAYSALSPADIDYLEGHGTATAVGDETELDAITRFFGPHFSAQKPLYLGSVKALTGHTLAAAGLVSLIKGVLMLRHQCLPPHVAGSRHAALSGQNVVLPATLQAWEKPADRPRRLGISGLGFGGANAHVVLEEHDATACAGRSPSARLGALPSAAVDLSSGSPGLAILDMSGQWAGFASLTEALNNTPASGLAQCFPREITIEAKGLRMGPRFLERIDPLQLLLIHHIHRLQPVAGKNPARDRHGVVTVNNLGGSLCLKYCRRHAVEFGGLPLPAGVPAVADIAPDFTLESIASCLPALMSGYPAFHFDFNGFHEQVSGGPLTFWRTLAMAPYWLAQRAQELFLGAATSLKSPLDLQAAEPPGEAVMAFRLALTHQLTDNDRPLAIIRQMQWRRDAVTPLDPGGLGLAPLTGHHLIDLDKAGRLGNLKEIQGIDGFVAVLAQAPVGLHLIEVREQGECLLVLEVEKCRDFSDAPPSLQLPFRLRFDTYANTRHGQPPQAAPLYRRVIEAQRNAMIAFFDSQAQLARIFSGVRTTMAITAPEHSYQYTGSHQLIKKITVDPSTGKAQALLLVDETHPYFFDHPLDHVPGISMIAGMLQLAEHVCAQVNSNVTTSVLFLEVRFKRFCEKNKDVELQLQFAQGHPSAHRAIKGQLQQNGQSCGELTLRAGPLQRPVLPKDYVAPPKRPDNRWLHKHRRENVLVSLLENRAPVYRCQAFMPPDGHFFSQGHSWFLSPLYVLEISRQFTMLYAHQIQNVPVGMPMNLISVQVDLSRLPSRGHQLELRIDETKVDDTVLPDCRLTKLPITLHDMQGELGCCTITAQVVDRKTYQAQRTAG